MKLSSFLGISILVVAALMGWFGIEVDDFSIPARFAIFALFIACIWALSRRE
jgi:hypothetical protein